MIRWFCTAYLSLYITRWSPWKRSSEETLLKWSWSKRDVIRFSVAVVSGLDETQCVGNVHNKLSVGVLMSSTSWPARPSTLVFLFSNHFNIIQAPSLSHGALTMIFLYWILWKLIFQYVLPPSTYMPFWNTPQSSLKTLLKCSYYTHFLLLYCKKKYGVTH